MNPITCHLRKETDIFLTAALFLLQTKLHHFLQMSCFQIRPFSRFVVLFWMYSGNSCTEGLQSQTQYSRCKFTSLSVLSTPADHAVFDTGMYAISLLSHLGILLLPCYVLPSSSRSFLLVCLPATLLQVCTAAQGCHDETAAPRT